MNKENINNGIFDWICNNFELETKGTLRNGRMINEKVNEIFIKHESKTRRIIEDEDLLEGDEGEYFWVEFKLTRDPDEIITTELLISLLSFFFDQLMEFDRKLELAIGFNNYAEHINSKIRIIFYSANVFDTAKPVLLA